MAEKKTLTILSLFDGISCGQLALQRAGIPVGKYYASEIDPYAIGVTRKHFPATIQLGDVTKWKNWDLPKIDLLIGGSPCQGFSNAHKGGLNFEDPRSRLFFEFVKILKYYRPKYWMLENVRMKKAWQDIISDYLGIQPILINSALVSAQHRPRLYWANFPIIQPEDRHIYLKDILEYPVDPKFFLDTPGSDKPNKKHAGKNLEQYEHVVGNQNGAIDSEKSFTVEALYYKGVEKNFGSRPFVYLSERELAYMNRQVKDGRTHWDFHHHSDTANDKSSAVVANFSKGVPYNVLIDRRDTCIQVGLAADINGHDILKRVYSVEGKSPALNAHGGGNTEPKIATGRISWRKLTPLECERLQTLPDLYTQIWIQDGLPYYYPTSNTQRYKMIGNGWTVDVVAHIFRCMKGE